MNFPLVAADATSRTRNSIILMLVPIVWSSWYWTWNQKTHWHPWYQWGNPVLLVVHPSSSPLQEAMSMLLSLTLRSPAQSFGLELTDSSWSKRLSWRRCLVCTTSSSSKFVLGSCNSTSSKPWCWTSNKMLTSRYRLLTETLVLELHRQDSTCHEYCRLLPNPVDFY